ncbi:MAG TPA: SIMPL domain-containing protein [Thermoanaerobaculia bacterium]|nr:SIMPL domain-containing protein [Thermoanaerobaculia bacterium]
MDGSRIGSGWGVVVASALLAVGMVVAVFVGGQALRDVKPGRTITVKGFSERPIVSDHAVWSGNLVARSSTLAEGYDKLAGDLARVRRYLAETGIPDEQVSVSPVSIGVRFRQTDNGMWTGEVDGYDLNQTVTVSSADVRAVERVAREITALIREGVEVNSWSPSYYYTRLDDLKIEMLGEAAADARRRAEEIAAKSGSGVGELINASQGVFQITPAFSTEISAGGMYDTSSIDKTIRAVVTIGFGVD